MNEEEEEEENEENNENEEENNHKSKQIIKKPIDKNAPKKPQTSFFLFSNDRRLKIKEEEPQLKNTIEISKKIGQEWKLLNEEEKNIYSNKAKENYEKYQQEYKKYQETDLYKQYEKQLNEWKKKK